VDENVGDAVGVPRTRFVAADRNTVNVRYVALAENPLLPLPDVPGPLWLISRVVEATPQRPEPLCRPGPRH
jgi:hypothetical protein